MPKVQTDKKLKRFFHKNSFLYERGSGAELIKLGRELRIHARARVEGEDEPLIVIKFCDCDGHPKTKYVPSSQLLTNQSTMTALTKAGYVLPSDKMKRAAVYEYISAARPSGRILVVRRPGWVNGKFALPGVTIGQKKSDDHKIYFKPAPGAHTAKYGYAGNLNEHKQTVGKYGACSTTITFSMCFAIASPLIGLCGLESGGVHAVAPSTSGKTLCLLAARSISGEAKRGDLIPWRTTANALERVAYAYNDNVMCLDDSSRLPGNREVRALTMREVAYTAAGGHGKLRLSDNGAGTAHRDIKWNVFVLSNGEEKLAEIVEGGGSTRMGGEEVRLADLPCDVHPEYGVFEKLPKGAANFDAAVAMLEQACARHYGTPLRAFLKEVVSRPNKTKKAVKMLMEDFLQKALVGKDGWEARFAKKFAAAYAAGVLAVRCKIFPWSEEHVEHSSLACYRRARAAIPEMETLIEAAMKTFRKAVRDPAKVVDLRQLKQREREQLAVKSGMGFVRSRPELGIHLVVRPEEFVKWFDRARDAQLALQSLDKAGKLMRDPTNPSIPTRQVLMPWRGPKLRYYVIIIADK